MPAKIDESRRCSGRLGDLIPKNAVHDRDVVARPMVVENVSVAAVAGWNPPSVELGSVGHVEIDVLVDKWRVVRAAISIAGLARCSAGRCRNCREWVRNC